MKKTKQITYTAVMIALLVAVQYVTRSTGQFVTGSCVNLILAVSARMIGIVPASVVALFSPFFAFLLGIGPQKLPLVPAIAAGNLVFVLLIALCGEFFSKRFRETFGRCITVVIAACAKFLVLWLVIVQLLLPHLALPEQQFSMMSVMFSWPQLVTALIGGILSIAVVPVLQKAINKK